MRVLTRNGAYEIFNARLYSRSKSLMKDEELIWEVRFRDRWQELSVLVTNREEGYDLIEEVSDLHITQISGRSVKKNSLI